MERNIYGCIEKYEIEFCDDDIIEEAYSSKEEFNKDSMIYKFMMSAIHFTTPGEREKEKLVEQIMNDNK